MRVTTKIVSSVVAGLVIAAAGVLPAHAQSASVEDKKNDTLQSTVTVTDGNYAAKTVAKKDVYVDITKVTAKHTKKSLIVTIKVAKVKKGYVNQVAVLIRTKKTSTAQATAILNLDDPTLSFVSTNETAVNPAGLKIKTKAGKNGTYTVTIPVDAFGSPKKLSVAATVVHLKSAPGATDKVVTTTDTTGSAKKSIKGIKWTAFIKA